MAKKISYMQRLQIHAPKPVVMSDEVFTIPHQAVTPRQILESWIRNDYDTTEHQPTLDWKGGDVHPQSIRTFDDKFEVMEYIAEVQGEPVTTDNLGNAVTPVDASSAEESPAQNTPAE